MSQIRSLGGNAPGPGRSASLASDLPDRGSQRDEQGRSQDSLSYLLDELRAAARRERPEIDFHWDPGQDAILMTVTSGGVRRVLRAIPTTEAQEIVVGLRAGGQGFLERRA